MILESSRFEDRIINGNKKDNFGKWANLDLWTPCSEIHVDLRSEEEKQKLLEFS